MKVYLYSIYKAHEIAHFLQGNAGIGFYATTVFMNGNMKMWNSLVSLFLSRDFWNFIVTCKGQEELGNLLP